MSERRKWDKQSEFHPPSGAPQGGGGADLHAPSAANGANDPVLEKQRQYIKMLEERNRLKKKLAAASKSQKEKGHLQEREEAFVTTFNVPKVAVSGAAQHHSGVTVRKNKSATSLLPTKMAPQPSCASSSSASSLLGVRNLDNGDRQSQCKSAPMTTLNFPRGSSGAGDVSARGDGDAQQQQHPRGTARAKWSKPQGPMNVAVENRDGRAHFCLTDQVPTASGESDAKSSAEEKSLRLECKSQDDEDDEDNGANADGDDEENPDDVEESYLEESFEDEEVGDASDGECEEIIAERKESDFKKPVSHERGEKASVRDAAANGNGINTHLTSGRSDNDSGVLASAPVLSRTTTELFDIIQHLSRSKQKALTEVLQRFETGEQRESDVRELQSSIGDPQIWKQLTATLFSNTTTEMRDELSVQRAKPAACKAMPKQVDRVPPSTSLAQVLEEQKQWEEEYARQVKERLVKERVEKERAMREAEERRMAMMKLLEEEEKELERLMELKRQERLAKLRALEQEVESVPVPLVAAASSVKKRMTDAECKSLKPDRQNTAREQRSPKDHLRASASLEVRSSDKEKKRGKIISPKKKSNKEQQSWSSLEDDLLRLTSEAKPTPALNELTLKAGDESSPPRSKPKKLDYDSTARNTNSSPVVPPLKLGLTTAAPSENEPTSFSVELRIKLLSTWGETRAVGLTQVTVYDANGVELAVDTASLKIFDQSDSMPLPKSHEMVRGLHRLFNGTAYTNSEQDMWLGRLSDTGALQVSFEVLSAPSKLCVWNYNSKLTTACARDIEVLVSSKCVWTGSLPETFGDEEDNLCTWINVVPAAKKTARTARQDDRLSSSRSTSAVTESKDAAEGRYLLQSARVDKSSTGAPLWLSESTPSSAAPLSSRGVSSSNEAKQMDLFAVEEKVSTGNLTARRRQQPVSFESSEKQSHDSKESDRHQRSGYQSDARDTAAREKHADAKHHHVSTFGNEARHKPVEVVLSQLRSSSSMWDSLEHFSKTNRGRLPQATDDDGTYPSSGIFKADEKETPERRLASSITSSALLSELQSMPSTLYGPGSGMPPLSAATKNRILSSTAVNSHSVISDEAPVTPSIPVLPSGTRLKLEILSTWGDPHYVGLNGIEIFDQHGVLISFQNPARQVRACPASINDLDEYSDDPRVAKNLVDGVNFTSDDFHMWLAPFTVGEEHFVELVMDAKTSISMIRLWNYNKSRAHSFRGVRHARLILYGSPRSNTTALRLESSGSVIFEGEISKALGLVNADSIDQSCEVILFTRDEVILQAIESNDKTLMKLAQNNDEEEETHSIVANVRSSMEMQRPRTSDKGMCADSGAAGIAKQHEPYSDYMSAGNNEEQSRVGRDGRPMTAAVRSQAVRASVDSWISHDVEPQEKSPVLEKVAERYEEDKDEHEDDDESLVRGRRLMIKLISTWGDTNYIGLTQLDVLVGKNGVPFTLDQSQIDATPRDLESLGYHGDPRTLDKLIDGVGTTCDDTHMWLIPLSTSQEIRIDLKKDQLIYGLRIWNYNKSSEDTFRGVKQLHVSIDGLLVSPKESGFVIRKAPGITLFDFDQVIKFESCITTGSRIPRAPSYLDRIHYPFQIRTYKTPAIKQDYEPSLFPQGFLLKFIFWTTWGDPYYLGLNGMEIYDFHGKKLQFAPQVITAQPYSIAEVSGKSGGSADDVRVPENLLNGRNKNKWDASDAWLAPLASSLGKYEGNIVYVVFDAPIVISMIKFWNYSKTPERGVKEMDIYLDDLHLYSGTLRKAPGGGDGHNVGRLGTKVQVTEDFSQPILFSTNQAQVDMEKRKVLYCGLEEQDVLCINEGQVMQESKAMYRKPDPGAEGVVVDLGLRPTTALCRH